MNFLLSLFITALMIMPGMKYMDAEKQLGRQPDFKYERTLNGTMRTMKFGVYGWDENTAWYGLQTNNDTVINFFEFKTKKEYVEYITFKEN